MLGNPLARRVVLGLAALAPLAWIGAAMIPSGTPTSALVVGAALSAFAWPNLARASENATTDAFEAQTALKNLLHRSSWESVLSIAAFLALGPWLGL